MHQKIQTRLFQPAAGQNILFCDDPDTLGIRKTLRLQEGEWVACFNGNGMEYWYRIDSADRKSLTLHLQHSFLNPRDEETVRRIFVATTKGKTRDRIVRDLPPLGATEICFYCGERSIAKLEMDSHDRLWKIAVEACRQCGRSRIPSIIIEESGFLDLLERNTFSADETLVFWEGETGVPGARWSKPYLPTTLVFGPEGGFSPQEIEAVGQRGIVTSSLGKRILRTELAVAIGTAFLDFRHRTMEEAQDDRGGSNA